MLSWKFDVVMPAVLVVVIALTVSGPISLFNLLWICCKTSSESSCAVDWQDIEYRTTHSQQVHTASLPYTKHCTTSCVTNPQQTGPNLGVFMLFFWTFSYIIVLHYSHRKAVQNNRRSKTKEVRASLSPSCIKQVSGITFYHTHSHTHLMAFFPGLPKWAGTRKVKPIWILLKQETVSGSGISWAVCKSAPCSRQITTPVPHTRFFYRPDALPATQPTASKHWRHYFLAFTLNQCCSQDQL